MVYILENVTSIGPGIPPDDELFQIIHHTELWFPEEGGTFSFDNLPEQIPDVRQTYVHVKPPVTCEPIPGR